MKNVMIYAYTNYNFGDDLFIKILCDRYPNCVFKLYTYSKYREVFKKNKNLHIYSNSNVIFKIINRIGNKFEKPNLSENIIAKNCDLCIYIGGSLFIQGKDNWIDNYKYLKSRKIKNVPFYLVGANFGPYKDLEYYEKFKSLFETYDDVCFREAYSYNIFKDLKNVRKASDIVFSYNILHKKKSQKSISISVINLDNRSILKKYKKQYIKMIEEICIYYIDKYYSVNLVSFCEKEGDEIAINEIYNSLKKYQNNIKKFFYKNDIKKIIDVFSKSEIIIASRFHAMIMGWVLDKKVMPIVYDEKMQNVINDLHFSGYYVRIDQIDNFDIDECSNSISYISKNKLKFAKKDAIKQFEKLDKILK